MSLIGTEVKPFKAQAYHNGAFVEVTEADFKGKWSVVCFYPADFTFVPHGTGRSPRQLRRPQGSWRRGILRIHGHPFHPQGLA